MARYNEILVGRYNRFLQKLFAMKGGPVAPQLASEIAPAFPLFSGVENRYLESWNLFGFRVAIAAVALNASGFRFRNPAGSNVVAVFTKLGFTLGSGLAASTILINLGAGVADLTTPFANSNARMDPRGSASPQLIISTQSTTPAVPAISASAASIGVVNLAASANYDFIVTDLHEFPLLPGDELQCANTVVNNPIDAAVFWRERFLEDSERF